MTCAACGAEPGPETAVVVDSAGVRLIGYDLPDRAVPVFRVLGPFDLELGATDGPPEYTFSRIAALAIADDGSLVVSDALARELRIFRADGTYRGSVGRPGEGPGEFGGPPVIAGLFRDTLFTFDARARRISVFLLDGELVGETTLPDDRLGLTESVLRLDDGSYVSRSNWVNPATVDEVYELRLELDSIVVEHRGRDASVIDTLRLVGDRNRARSVAAATGGGFRTRQMTTPHSPEAVVVVDGSRLIVGRSDAFALAWIGPARGEEMVVRVSGVGHPATAGEIRARREATLRREFGDREIDPMIWRGQIEYLPERLPAFGDVVVSADGDVWVSLTELDLSEGLDWLVFDEAGVMLGRVHTPPAFHLLAVRDDHVAGYVLDDLDIPYVRRYPLAAVGGPS